MLTRVFVIALTVVLLWVVNSRMPMGGSTRNILNLVAGILLIAWLLRTLD